MGLSTFVVLMVVVINTWRSVAATELLSKINVAGWLAGRAKLAGGVTLVMGLRRC
jgi:hypothetical protein